MNSLYCRYAPLTLVSPGFSFVSGWKQVSRNPISFLLTTYHFCPSKRWVKDTRVLQTFRRSQALAPSRNIAVLCCGRSGVVRSVSEDLHGISQLSLTEQKECLPAGVVRATVVCRFGRHVGEVDSFVEHVAVHRSFGRRNAETLPKDTSVVGSARTMPIQIKKSVLFASWDSCNTHQSSLRSLSTFENSLAWKRSSSPSR